jgi:uncharacterized protein (DUF362 family)
MTSGFDERTVVIHRARRASYPLHAPFHPDADFPEYAFPGALAREPNAAYAAVRDILRQADLDPAGFGTPGWNPLGGIIRPGDFVVLKPNMIKDLHPRDPQGWVYTLTHGSVIRAVADYVFKALDGRGRVMVADAPQTEASFERMVRLLGLDTVAEFYRARGLRLEVVDLRREAWVEKGGVIVERRERPGDPEGYVAFDLGARSEFEGHRGQGRYYGADYDAGEVNRHHSGGRHEYLISGSVARCDVLVNLPKLKTHKKAGITVNLKNLVGVNGDKNWLPHHTEGFPEQGGDQYPRATLGRRVEHGIASRLRRVALALPAVGPWLLQQGRRTGTVLFGDATQAIRSGNWHGNDTTWRMCLDLNKIVLYGRPDGSFREPRLTERKRYLSFVDGIVAGQGNGPIDPDPAPIGALLFGTNPVSVDVVAALLMGFSPERIPVTRQAFAARGFPLCEGDWRDIRARSDHAPWSGSCADLPLPEGFGLFRPHFGWLGHIERTIP